VKKRFVGLFIAWLFLVVFALYAAFDSGLSQFDPEFKLAQSSGTMRFDQEVALAFKSEFGEVSNTIFHITTSDCRCNLFAEKHVAVIDDIVVKNGFTSKMVNAEDVPWLTDWVPSVPAVVVFDQEQQLAYLGPYAPGALCAVADSFVDSLIKTLNQATSIGGVVIHDAEGCYCNLTG